MSSTRVYDLIDLIENIKKVDEIIMLHSSKEADDIMLLQYQAKKSGLTSSLVNELTSDQFSSTSSLLFIKHFLEKFYADSSQPTHNDKQLNDIKQLELAL